MKGKQLYFTELMIEKLEKTFGEGKVSANVERILWIHLKDPSAEKKAAMMSLQQHLKEFNSEYNECFELIKEDTPPMPP